MIIIFHAFAGLSQRQKLPKDKPNFRRNRRDYSAAGTALLIVVRQSRIHGEPEDCSWSDSAIREAARAERIINISIDIIIKRRPILLFNYNVDRFHSTSSFHYPPSSPTIMAFSKMIYFAPIIIRPLIFSRSKLSSPLDSLV